MVRKRLDFLDEIPVMSSTILGLEMLLQEPCIDLRAASDLVLSDVGATIQTLRLVGREYDSTDFGPSRMADCVAGLELDTWFRTISALTFASDEAHAATAAVWEHCRLVAQYAQLVAESMGGIAPEDAYLVGLLHEVRSLPSVLGYRRIRQVGSAGAAQFSIEDALPQFVLAAIDDFENSSRPSTWSSVLKAAHELAVAGSNFEPSGFDAFTIHSRA